MTHQQIKAKIESLDWWLTQHPNDPSYTQVLQDKLQLEQDLNLLENKEYDE